ncbi:hypothetical protein [Aurantiacibacter marinus]|uniref:hypothetical protein n=1 Tax=Aurantiacibacter marinus TaxID=874156 RepID=UPI0012E00E5B|nr:hypothetical protein [Aurantiacibacter marinus]
MKAVLVNATLKHPSEPSHTDALLDVVAEISTSQRAAFANEFTQRKTTFMAFNLLHAARMPKAQDGYPAVGNVRMQWDAGCKPG